MGASQELLLDRSAWKAYLRRELTKSSSEKEIYYVIWELEGQPVGHSNINQIKFGSEAVRHLHLWKENHRKMGLGKEFLEESVPYYI